MVGLLAFGGLAFFSMQYKVSNKTNTQEQVVDQSTGSNQELSPEVSSSTDIDDLQKEFEETEIGEIETEFESMESSAASL